MTPDRGLGTSPNLPEKRRESTGVGRFVEKAIENPTLVIAGLAAVPLLFLVWGATRRWRDKRLAEEETTE